MIRTGGKGEITGIGEWAAACYRLKPRDLEIGWNRAMCAKRLKLIANNRRFTILDEKGARPNLASQLLGMDDAVVLGCVRILKDGCRNQFYGYRIRAAAELYKAGKVKAVIVSGDNHVKGYDEPSDMKEDLVAAGIPAEKVVCDYAGFRTLDSVVRAKEVFGAERFIVVSQPFHVRRALFLAWGFGCDAYGYAAEDVRGINSIMTLLREQLAKVAALMDVVIRRQPKFLGAREELPE